MFGRRKCIGLALGAGGARGIAHIGVLKLFENESIPIDLLAGTSIGALVGGAFASGSTTHDLIQRVDEFLQDPIFLNSSLESIRELEANKRLSLVQKIQMWESSTMNTGSWRKPMSSFRRRSESCTGPTSGWPRT